MAKKKKPNKKKQQPKSEGHFIYKYDQKLEEDFRETLGDNWREPLQVTLRADQWYWLMHMACIGLSVKRDAMDKTDACAIASLASLDMDLEQLWHKIADEAVVAGELREA